MAHAHGLTAWETIGPEVARQKGEDLQPFQLSGLAVETLRLHPRVAQTAELRRWQYRLIGLSTPQAQAGDFGGAPDAERNKHFADAPAHVNLRPLQAVPAFHKAPAELGTAIDRAHHG